MKPTHQAAYFISTGSMHRLIGTLIILGLVLTACGDAAAEPLSEPAIDPKTTVVISGSGGTTSVLEFLASHYAETHDDLAFEFLAGSGSGGGVKGVAAGLLDLGAMSRPPKDSELANGIEYLHFATDPIVVAISPDLSISHLTSQQVSDIFGSVITNWSEVGGPDALINLFVRDEEESSTQLLRDGLFGDVAFGTRAVVLTSEAEMQAALSNGINAIGFLSYSAAQAEETKIQALVIDGEDPTDINGRYPYTRPLGVAFMPANAAKVQSFLDFITGTEGQALLAGLGIAPSR